MHPAGNPVARADDTEQCLWRAKLLAYDRAPFSAAVAAFMTCLQIIVIGMPLERYVVFDYLRLLLTEQVMLMFTCIVHNECVKKHRHSPTADAAIDNTAWDATSHGLFLGQALWLTGAAIAATAIGEHVVQAILMVDAAVLVAVTGMCYTGK